MSQIRVLVADDGALFRAALRSLFAARHDMALVGEATDGLEAVQLAEALQPDVVLMDVRMPRLDGVAATQQICVQQPQCRVLLLTMFEDDRYIFGGLQAGAIGYLLKDADPEDLIRAIQVAVQDQSFLYPSVARKIVAAVARAGRAAEPQPLPPAVLSARELAILRLVADGQSNRAIGAQLHLTEGSVKNALTLIMDKLDARDRTHAAILAKDRGLI